MKQSVEQRIERVVSNLLPQTAFRGRWGPPASLHERLARHHTPGVSIAVINDFDIDWACGFGTREAGSQGEVTSTTLFQAASISKPVFAIAVNYLAQEGRIDLDEDINVYLRSWRVPANEGWQPRITLRQLLSHSAGLTVHGFPGYQRSEPIPNVPQILAGEPPANSERVEVNILPGLQTRYSGGGTTVAQQVLIDSLGRPFPEIMRTLVLDPLGMTNSTFEQPLPDDWATRAATAHSSKGIPITGKHHTYPEMAAAGLWTTPTDLAKVGVELLKGSNGEPQSLLEKETVEAMLSSQLPGQREGDGEFAGLGFFCSGKGDRLYFGHGGSNEGFMAIMRIYANIGKGAVVMCNLHEGYLLLEEILRAIAVEYEWPGVFPPEKDRVTLARVDGYSGVYVSESGVEFNVTGPRDNVMLQLPDQQPLQLIATSDREFFTEAVDVEFTFDRDANNSITAMTVSQLGEQLRAERKS